MSSLRQRLAGAALVAAAGLAGAVPAAAQARQVVLLYDERTTLPGLAVLDAGLVRTLGSAPEPVEIYREAMDLSRFGSDAYLHLLRDYLHAKYAGKRIDVVIAVLGPSLDFVLAHDDLFPGAAVVFCGVDRDELAGRTLPPHVTGVLLERDFAPTAEVALLLQPETERMVLVSGSAEFDRRIAGQAIAELRAYEGRFELVFPAAQRLEDLLAEVSRLPPNTVVLYTTMFRDGTGAPWIPHEVAERLSAAANAPVYGFVDQYLGRGIVGGHLYSLETHGEQAAGLALQILAGAEPAELPPVERSADRTMLDWRQLRRWRLDPDRLPPDAVVLYRQPSLWSEYRFEVLAAASLVLLQGAMIAGLLAQYLRRRRAESERREAELALQRQRVELAHLSRVATVGELTASVAHELNQPLGAILANAEAAERFLAAEPPALDEVREILADIRDNDLRASEIIHGLRGLMERHEVTRRPLDAGELLREVVRLVSSEAAARGIDLQISPSPGLPPVLGDPVQLQQVILNLILNGFEAMSESTGARRQMIVSTSRGAADTVIIAVADTGPGISPDAAPRLFEPFFSTKPSGLGMGLSITCTIVEAHRGRVWAENNPAGGATFYVTLPFCSEGSK